MTTFTKIIVILGLILAFAAGFVLRTIICKNQDDNVGAADSTSISDSMSVVPIPPEVDNLKADLSKISAKYRRLLQDFNALNMAYEANLARANEIDSLVASLRTDSLNKAKTLAAIRSANERNKFELAKNKKRIDELTRQLEELKKTPIAYTYDMTSWKLRPGIAGSVGYGDSRYWSGRTDGTGLYADAYFRLQFFTLHTKKAGTYTFSVEQSLLRPKFKVGAYRYMNDCIKNWRNIQVGLGVSLDEDKLGRLQDGLNPQLSIAVNF